MQYLLLLVFLQLLWSSSYVAMKVALETMPVGLALVLRYGITALVFLLAGQLRGIRMSKRDFALAIAVGLLDFTISPYLQLLSLTLTRASDVSVVVALEPLLTAMIAALVLRERLGRDILLTFAVATVGVLIMSGLQLDGSSLFGPERLLGTALFLAAILCEAIYSVTGRKLSARYDPIKLGALMMTAGALGSLAANWRLLTPTHLDRIDTTGWLAMLYLALGCSAFAYSAWIWIIKRISVSRAALSLFLQPILGGFFGYLFLNEHPTWQSFIGAALTVGSLLVWLLTKASIAVNPRINE